MYNYFINSAKVHPVNEAAPNMYRFSKAEMIDMARNQKVSRTDDFVWCYYRDATAFAMVTIAGRRYINHLMTCGYPQEPIEEAIDFFYRNKMIDFNRTANYWHIMFSPIAENETKPKVWIKFPSSNKIVWFNIESYNPDKGFELSPNPRMNYTMKWFKEFNDEFNRFVVNYPKTFKYALWWNEEFFRRERIIRPSDSDRYNNYAFLCLPFPEKKPGDGEKLGVYQYNIDVNYTKTYTM